MKTVERAYYAWLSPLAGWGAALVVNVLMSVLLNQQTQEDRVVKIVLGLLPTLALLAFHVFGYIKSVQCLIGFRRGGHGIAGLAANTLSLVLLALVVVAGFTAAQQSRAAARVTAIVEEARGRLPIRIDENTEWVKVYADSPNVMTFEYRVTGIDPASVTPEGLAHLEDHVRETIRQNQTLTGLEGTGTKVRYLYVHEDGETMLDFVVDPEAP